MRSRVPYFLTLSLWACDPQAEPRPTPTADKARLFGDAGLVPTRAGEVARLEVALAGEIEAAIAASSTMSALRVHVRIEAEKRIVAITGSVAPAFELDDAVGRVRDVATSISGARASDVTVIVTSAPSVPTGPPTDLAALLPLLIACLGLGVSAGIALERSRRTARDDRFPRLR